MDFSLNEKIPAKNFTGITMVVLLHVLMVCAPRTGLASKVVEVIAKPVETKIIEKVASPSPPKMMAPLPFIPPSEVQVQQSQASTIASMTNVAPDKPTPFQHSAIPADMEGMHSPAIVDLRSCAPEHLGK